MGRTIEKDCHSERSEESKTETLRCAQGDKWIRLSDFDYELPKELVAQNALPRRAEARLLVLNRKSGDIEHRTFCDVTEYFEKGDILVLNDTKVIPARLFGKRKSGGRVEILLLGPSLRGSDPTVAEAISKGVSSPNVLVGDPKTWIPAFAGMTTGWDIWKALVKPSGRVRQGEIIELTGSAKIEVMDAPAFDVGIRHLRFEDCDVAQFLETYGRIPLPPYIDREDTPVDRELYQTIFARQPGAVASPTAGLHFDQALLNQIEAKGVEILFVTLHVGYGTFQPVASENLTQHKMYQECFDVSDEVAERINFAKIDGRRVIACGTTVVRALESVAVGIGTGSVASCHSREGASRSSGGRPLGHLAPCGRHGGNPESGSPIKAFGDDSRPVPGVKPMQGMTDLFVYPPYEFEIVDAMITNFHLPRTTLLMLASAFAGHELLKSAYCEAIQKRYRFYSYGDAMLIL